MAHYSEKPLDYHEDLATSSKSPVIRLHLMTLIALIMISVVAVRIFLPALSLVMISSKNWVLTTLFMDILHSGAALVGIVLIFNLRQIGWILLNFFLVSRLTIIVCSLMMQTFLASSNSVFSNFVCGNFIDGKLCLWIIFLMFPLLALSRKRILSGISFNKKQMGTVWFWSFIATTILYGILTQGEYL